MKLSYFHVAHDVPNNKVPEAAVVTDVLRATTTIAFALHNGAEAIETFSNIDELKKRALNWSESSKLLLGERGGERLSGFDLGNSPAGVSRDVVEGKRLFMSTTNGTRSLERVREAQTLYTLALPNRSAIGDRLLIDSPDEVWIVGSGWEGKYSLEDSLAAGSLAAYLKAKSAHSVNIINDELTSALALWEKWQFTSEDCLRQASHGKRLANLGNHDLDFQICSKLDQLSIVPTQIEPGVLRALDFT